MFNTHIKSPTGSPKNIPPLDFSKLADRPNQLPISLKVRVQSRSHRRNNFIVVSPEEREFMRYVNQTEVNIVP